ncbi:MAG: glycoside hydrolase family 15 protein [Elusimicrobiota bacterium]
MNVYDHGIIGNCTTSALVSSDCSINWLCMPFFDSSSVFAKILDEEKGGYFKISAQNVIETNQTYIKDTAILKTVFKTKEGEFEVSDYMPRFVTQDNEYYCPPEIHRNINLISGRPIMKIEFQPRPHYGASGINFEFHKHFIKAVSDSGEHTSLYLYTNLEYDNIIECKPVEISASFFLVLSYHDKLEPVDLNRVINEYEMTKAYWISWAHRTKTPKEHKELVIRSAITLKLLMFQRTGAVIAAPTTSLPEIVGEERNWDYRYCWVRDASMVIDLYARMGHTHTARHFIDFIINRLLLKHHNISVMYGINGEKELEEFTLGHLSGYKDSKPVRVGNAAYKQKQNDVYGELIDTIYTYFKLNKMKSLTNLEEIWTVVRTLVNHVIAEWDKPDSGIWERRDEPRHYVYSKMMSWVAMDRALKIAEILKKYKYADRCRKYADIIKEDILANGWDEEVKAFTMYYGSKDLDASNLLMLHYGFLDKTDSKMLSTVRQTYEQLVKNNHTFRYTANDDFGAPKNAFIVCIFWMIDALYIIDEQEKAQEMFENIIAKVNKLGLLSEGIEIDTGNLVGNFPQGYSHLALIQTIFLLETKYNWTDYYSDTKNT